MIPLQDHVCSQFDSTWEAENELRLGVYPHLTEREDLVFPQPSTAQHQQTASLETSALVAVSPPKGGQK